MDDSVRLARLLELGEAISSRKFGGLGLVELFRLRERVEWEIRLLREKGISVDES